MSHFFKNLPKCGAKNKEGKYLPTSCYGQRALLSSWWQEYWPKNSRRAWENEAIQNKAWLLLSRANLREKSLPSRHRKNKKSYKWYSWYHPWLGVIGQEFWFSYWNSSVSKIGGTYHFPSTLFFQFLASIARNFPTSSCCISVFFKPLSILLNCDFSCRSLAQHTKDKL